MNISDQHLEAVKILKYSDQNTFPYSCDDIVVSHVKDCIINPSGDRRLSAESFKVLCYKY